MPFVSIYKNKQHCQIGVTRVDLLCLQIIRKSSGYTYFDSLKIFKIFIFIKWNNLFGIVGFGLDSLLRGWLLN